LRIVCLSDTHGLHSQLEVPEGDILLHGGDLTRMGQLDQLSEAADWLRSLPHRYKIVIAGNHDFCLEQQPQKAEALLAGLTYLKDQLCHCEGLKIYGSPWQPWFHDWAFNLRRGEPLRKVWAQIPTETDIVITHGPPQGILDRCYDGREVGCQDLLERLEVVRPRLHVFGHIHEAYGQRQVEGTLFVNASNRTLQYRPTQKPVVIDLT